MLLSYLAEKQILLFLWIVVIIKSHLNLCQYSILSINQYLQDLCFCVFFLQISLFLFGLLKKKLP